MVTTGMSKLLTLKKNYEFQRVYGRGKYASSRTLVVYVLANRSGTGRMGITTSRKVGKSVVRNRIRRLIRENLRVMAGSLPIGRDIVVVARKADESAGFESVGRELRLLFIRLGLLEKPAAKEREKLPATPGSGP
jgi:ribonuclease P protein component